MSRLKKSRASRWTPSEARATLAEMARSGLPVVEFAAERGLGVERLYRWKRRLQGARGAVVHGPRFAEVTIRPSAAAAAIEIELVGGVSLRLSGESRVDDAVSILSRLPVR